MDYTLQRKPLAQDETGRASPQRGAALPGDAGFWTFIAADATLFALLFFQYSKDRSTHASVFDNGRHALLLPLGAINTLVLITSSFLMAMAVRSMHGPNTTAAIRWMLGTVSLGAVFAVLKVVEYRFELASGHTLSTSPFFMYYFVITGIHLLHLIVGVLAVSVIAIQLRRGGQLNRGQVVLECGAAYWHLVDLLWMFIFPLLYLAR